MPRKTQGGNCVFGAVYLSVKLRVRPRFCWFNGEPHFYVRDREGRCWHFREVEPALPGVLGWLWFRGRFARMRDPHRVD